MKEIKNVTWKGFRERPVVIDVFWEENHTNMPVVIFAHGYKGFKDWGAWNLMAKKFASSGFLFIKFNFSFNGGTPEQPIDFPDLQAFGENNYSTEVGDLKRVVDFVHSSHILPRKKINLDDISFFGHSRGGGMTILASSEEKRVHRLITLASICDLERRQPKGKALEEVKRTGVMYVKNSRTCQMMPHFYQMQEDYITNKERFDIGRAAREMDKPWLIIHGNEDKTVPYSEAQELVEHQPKAQFITIDGGNHVFGAMHPWEKDEMPDDLMKVVDKCLSFLKN